MPYTLEYKEDNKNRIRFFNSYYECVKTKKELQKEGIKDIILKDDVKRPESNYIPKRPGEYSKMLVRRFLQIDPKIFAKKRDNLKEELFQPDEETCNKIEKEMECL